MKYFKFYLGNTFPLFTFCLTIPTNRVYFKYLDSSGIVQCLAYQGQSEERQNTGNLDNTEVLFYC